MKRKITDLEQRLINKGYRLAHKEYGGRKSEKTLSYYYIKDDQFVRLNYKRDEVVSLGLLNYCRNHLTKYDIDGLRIRIYNIEQDIKEQEPKETKPQIFVPCDDDEQVVEYIGSMTPEQFDELCQEMEK